MTKGGEEGHGLPAPLRDLGPQPLTARPPAPKRRHVGLGPRLVDEDQAGRLDPALARRPLQPPARHVRAIPFAGERGFF